VYSPQILENYRLKSGEGLSVAFVVIWLLGDIFNLAGGLMAGIIPTAIILAIYVSCIYFVLQRLEFDSSSTPYATSFYYSKSTIIDGHTLYTQHHSSYLVRLQTPKISAPGLMSTLRCYVINRQTTLLQIERSKMTHTIPCLDGFYATHSYSGSLLVRVWLRGRSTGLFTPIMVRSPSHLGKMRWSSGAVRP
jgi:hypothetical protein